jgi:hypothetical protein
MPGMYYFNCNGPIQVGPYGNCNEALQDSLIVECIQQGGQPQFLGCDQAPCGCPNAPDDLSWKPNKEFLEAATKRSHEELGDK